MTTPLDVLMITYNRPKYTAMALKQLLDTCETGMRVWIWQNGGHPETLEVIKSFHGHPHLANVHVSPENKRLRDPTNWFWQQSKASFLAKVDDDCLVPSKWGSTLIDAHRHSPKLGMIGCWRFYEHDFDRKLAAPKLCDLPGGHGLMRSCWVQGSGYVMKREVVSQLGLLGPTESFGAYCIRAAKAGWLNGWYFPFLHEEHMDDPRSPYTELKSEEEFRRNKPLTAIKFKVETLEEYKDHVRWMARCDQAVPYDPSFFEGWRARLRNASFRLEVLAGFREPWRFRC